MKAGPQRQDVVHIPLPLRTKQKKHTRIEQMTLSSLRLHALSSCCRQQQILYKTRKGLCQSHLYRLQQFKRVSHASSSHKVDREMEPRNVVVMMDTPSTSRRRHYVLPRQSIGSPLRHLSGKFSLRDAAWKNLTLGGVGDTQGTTIQSSRGSETSDASPGPAA